MEQKSGPGKAPAEQVPNDIRPKHAGREDAIALEGLQGEEIIFRAKAARDIAASMYYWVQKSSSRTIDIAVVSRRSPRQKLPHTPYRAAPPFYRSYDG
ncbi:hypothetical protein NLM27_27020 [Bradyrhizobium sp. CCGB12]|uniref:hypothetical protein n=1 Tax=Bradyrhizobium sp. CCGB12 TaxID=2949632 RepID=UPI0020B30C70|nr:hypothetical protein [Bradyrhizobium sp. CCGB12]MCP3392402.1 hypothetical protein [Bradyrhizobium sp. CCGB12]